jgi:hypothetical protein
VLTGTSKLPRYIVNHGQLLSMASGHKGALRRLATRDRYRTEEQLAMQADVSRYRLATLGKPRKSTMRNV